RRTELAAGGIGGVIAHACRRRPRAEVPRRRKALADDARSNDPPIAFDELSIGLVGEYDLRDTRNDQWIDHAQQQRRHEGHEHGDKEIASYIHEVTLRKAEGCN